MVPSSSECARQLHLAQLFQGPAQQALAYAFSYAYTQSSDVLGYITAQELRLQFTEAELQLLGRARSPALFTLPVLYKVFRFCCSCRLQDCHSREWEAVTPACNTLEGHIATLHHQYTTFTSCGGGQVEAVVEAILGVVRGAGEQLGVKRWQQQHQALNSSIQDILEDVHPGMDVKERLANAAAVECELRCQAIAEGVAAHRALRTEGDEEQGEDYRLNLTIVPAGPVHHLQPSEDDTTVEPDDLLQVLQQRCSENIDGKKICCISGSHGSGKSCLAATFPVAWCKQSQTTYGIKELVQYDYVLLVSGKEIEQTSISKWAGSTKSQRNDLTNFIDDYWSVVEAFLPRCCAKYGVKNVGHFLTTQKVLFIVDDADEISEAKVKELVLFLGQIIFDSAVLILGNLESVTKIKFNFISYASVQHFHLHGVSREYLLELTNKLKENVKTGKKKVPKSMKDAIKSNLNRIGGLLQYPEIVRETIALFKSNPTALKDLFTGSEQLWNLFVLKCNTAFQVQLDKDIRKKRKLLKWAIVVGENALYCLKSNIKLNEASLEEIKESSEKLFPSEDCAVLMDTFFKRRLVFHSDTFQSIPSSTCLPQLQFFSSYFVVNALKTEDNVWGHLPKSNHEDLLTLVAGHVRRWDRADDTEEIGEEDAAPLFQKIIKSIVNYEAGKAEDVQFLMKLATEFRCCHKLVQLMVNVTEYPEEWDLQLCHLQHKTLEVMLQHVSPVRIILRTDEHCQNTEQVAVLKFLTKATMSVWFESKQQFEYGNNNRMDKFIRPFLNEKVTARVDLFSGSLSRIMILDLPDFKCMKYIVMLALRVTDEETLSSAVALPGHLPHILWFELKIDMSIENVVLTALPALQVEMFDVYIKDLDDLCIPQVTGLLTKLHKRYSGIHLEHTTLSPESIYTLLKELKQRGITLCASAKSVDKYRRWYYPLLSNLPTDKLLNDDEVRSILGFDDRKFYSDHKILSSTFVRSIEAWNLTSYLEELKEIKYFVYKADNLSFIKTLEGEVETEHHSDIKVDTTGTIL